MVTKIHPDLNEVLFINKYTMLHVLDGSGGIQVDFQNYFDWSDKIIFLEKGQYIKFLSDDFVVRKIEFREEDIFHNKDVRVLFKHLVSLGYINFQDCEECQKYLDDTVLLEHKDIVDISSKHWFWQNPFNANSREYHVIFDIKDVVDEEYRNHLSNRQLTEIIGHSHLNPHALFSDKVGITVKDLLRGKRFTEIQKEIAFSNRSFKGIAYDFGYKDPAYFSRVFKKHTGQTPSGFRENTDFETTDAFVQNLFELLDEFHAEHRKIDFYANKMHLSVKAFSRKVRDKLQISIGQLIRQQIIMTAKELLAEDLPVNEVAFKLGFEEANHFSAFFKRYTNTTPSAFQEQKYNH
ncbi:MAG: helix-turn-helix domain-containing protein [Balneolaceae bacterium]|nr:helix-turn-helix domain-containing protein [Balneolaceae bacterium]